MRAGCKTSKPASASETHEQMSRQCWTQFLESFISVDLLKANQNNYSAPLAGEPCFV